MTDRFELREASGVHYVIDRLRDRVAIIDPDKGEIHVPSQPNEARGEYAREIETLLNADGAVREALRDAIAQLSYAAELQEQAFGIAETGVLVALARGRAALAQTPQPTPESMTHG